MTPGHLSRPLRRARRWISGALWLAALAGAAGMLWALSPSLAAPPVAETPVDEPITPIPQPTSLDPLKVALGERLFHDPRLSGGNNRSCNSCHDVNGNGATGRAHDPAVGGGVLALNTPTVFNAGLSFRLNWTGDARTLQQQAQISIETPGIMGSRLADVVAKLSGDAAVSNAFGTAYGHPPDAESLLDALAQFEATLVTPNSRFDRWLSGDTKALSQDELDGYNLFKTIGCVSCHQGVNVGGNLFQRHGIFHPLASPNPAILRVPSLRNIATTPPYFHDGSAPTLEDAVRRMAYAQLDTAPSDEQVGQIVDFLRTLTGSYRGRPLQDAP